MQSENGGVPHTEEQFGPHQEKEEAKIVVRRRTRNEQPIRINADDQSKFMLFLYILTILLPLAILIILVIFALPQATRQVNPSESLVGTDSAICRGHVRRSPSNNYLSCFTEFTPDSQNSAGRYVRGMSNLNQFLLFYLDLGAYARSLGRTKATFTQTVIFSIWSASYDAQTHKVKVGSRFYSTVYNINNSYKYLRRNRIFLGIEAKITNEDQFYWEVTFQNKSVINDTSSFYLATETVREQFTIYTILLRVAFFLVSLAVFIRYSWLIVKVPKKRVSVEQRLVHILSALTLTFNDQLYFITVLWPNPVTSFISALFIWNFFFALFALWACFLVRIYYNEPDTQTVEIKRPHRLIPFVIFYFCGLAFSAAFALIQMDEHPILSVKQIDIPFFKFLVIATTLGFFLVIIYLLYLFITIKERNQLVAYRNSLFMNISLLFFIGVVVVIVLGSLDVFSYSSGLILFSFGICNLYSYLLQYLYAPTQQEIRRFNDQEHDLLENPRPFLDEDEADADTVEIDLSLLDENVGDKQSSLSYSNSPESRGSVRQRMRNRKKQMNESHQAEERRQQVGETRQKILREEQEGDDSHYYEVDEYDKK